MLDGSYAKHLEYFTNCKHFTQSLGDQAILGNNPVGSPIQRTAQGSASSVSRVHSGPVTSEFRGHRSYNKCLLPVLQHITEMFPCSKNKSHLEQERLFRIEVERWRTATSIKKQACIVSFKEDEA